MALQDMKEIQNPLDKEFIRLLTDFGFKRVFGSKERKNILKRFLNALFEGRMRITELEFHDKEIIPEHIDGKKVVFDIYCTTDKGKHFIIEMQQEEVENFSERILFYVCRGIVNQGKRGIEYEIAPVYCVALTNFYMPGQERRLVNEIALMERKSHRPYTDKLNLIFIALPGVPKEWDECKTELQRLLYLIKNMENLSKESKPYKSGEYDDLFTASATGNLSKEESVAYSMSYFQALERESAIRFAEKKAAEAAEKRGWKLGEERGLKLGEERGLKLGEERGLKLGEERGLKLGEERGLKLGEENTLRKNVSNLRAYGLDDATISEMLQYPLDYIRTL